MFVAAINHPDSDGGYVIIAGVHKQTLTAGNPRSPGSFLAIQSRAN